MSLCAVLHAALAIRFRTSTLGRHVCFSLQHGVQLCVCPPWCVCSGPVPPGGNASRKLGVVGKGLTFDSGGYNLKVGARRAGAGCRCERTRVSLYIVLPRTWSVATP